ncbi:MAG: Nif11-like leader peptide family natural product precursor [Acidobacteriota bacterium]
MSKKHAKNFLRHMDKDEALRKKVITAANRILKVAKDHGYEMTRAEFHDALHEKLGGKLPLSKDLPDPDTCVCIA